MGAGFVAVLDGLSRRRNFFTRKDLSDSTRKMRMFGEWCFGVWFSSLFSSFFLRFFLVGIVISFVRFPFIGVLNGVPHLSHTLEPFVYLSFVSCKSSVYVETER